MSDPLDLQRRDAAALEAELVAAGLNRKGKSWQCPDPAHPDNNPSAAAYQDDAGAWRVKCHACGWCGDIFDVRAAAQGRPVADVLREARQAHTPPKPATRPHTPTQAKPARDMLTIAKAYHTAILTAQRQSLADRLGISTAALERLRLGWCARDGAYSFPMRDGSGRVTGIRLRSGDDKYAERGGHDGLFIPAGLTGGDVLAICEGPTDTAALLDCGVDAIGRPNNAGTTAEDYIAAWLTAHPYREVWLITDNDPAGTKAHEATQAAAQRLAKRLASVVGAVRVFHPPDPHKDVRQWRQAGADLDDLTAQADNAEARGPAADLRKVLQAEIDGTRRAIGWPHRLVERGTQALLPGTVTLLVGDAGSGKSLWLLESLAYWHDAGESVACFMLEQDRSYHLKRALAQRTGASWLTDLEQVADRPSDTLAYHSEHADWLNGLGRTIDDAPDKPVSLHELIAWTQAKAEAGARVIAIDPITAATTTDRPWDDAGKFLHTTLPILDKHGASLVLVSHPRKGKQRGTLATMDDLAGGAAWVRFSHTILWLERHDEARSVTVRRPADPLPEAREAYRTMRIMKARNGKGAGWQLAVDMDPASLRFVELGAIVKADRTEANL